MSTMLPLTPGMIMVAAATQPITTRRSTCPTSSVRLSGLLTSPVSASAMMPAKKNRNTRMDTTPSFFLFTFCNSGLRPPKMRPMNAVEVGRA